LIDLHTHTTASDGTLSPCELVALGVARGIQVLAITDHDTLAGHDKAVPHAITAGRDLICGVELSTRRHLTSRSQRPPSVQLLGYFLEAQPSADFRDWLCSHQETRRARNRELISRLQGLGFRDNSGRGGSHRRKPHCPAHFARILQQKGYVPSRQGAFDVYLADDAQAMVESDEPGLVDSERRIRAAGALASLAHAVRPEAYDSAFLSKFLPALIDAGLQGLEVYHSHHNPEQTASFAELARRFGLVETDGSDFHGENKPGVELSSGRGNLAPPWAMLKKCGA
jgi:3',5'-nucleoside bisphosphate phosphatase